MSFARYALYLWAATIPFVSFTSEKVSTGGALSARFTVADLFGVFAILFSLPAGRWLKPNSFFPSISTAMLLFVAGTASYFTVLLSTATEPLLRIMMPWLIFAFLAVLAARASVLLRGEREVVLMANSIAAGGTIESFIVGHDLLSRLWGGAMWFRDPMDLRMRGTFRASGQLAQYGFVVGAVLFALAAWPGAVRARTRLWWSVTAVFLMLYPVFTTRRSGIVALCILLLAWVALSQVYGSPGIKKALPVLAPAALILFGYLGQAEYRTFLHGRVVSVQQRVAPGEGFLPQQFQDAVQSITRNPILGVGWGLSQGESRTGNEMHSTYLAVLVDSGLLGLFVFGAFVLNLLFLLWKMVLMTKRTPYFESALRFFVVFVAQLVFWIHNRGLRDRGFFLFIAVFTACAHYVSQRRQQEASAR